MNFIPVSNSGFSQLSLRQTPVVPALTVHLTTCLQGRQGYPNPTWVLGLPQQEGYPLRLVNALLGVNSPTRDSFPPSCVTSNLVNLNGITQYPIPELYYIHLNNIRYFLYTMIIFSHFIVNLTCFLQRTSSFISSLERYREYYAGKVSW